MEGFPTMRNHFLNLALFLSHNPKPKNLKAIPGIPTGQIGILRISFRWDPSYLNIDFTIDYLSLNRDELYNPTPGGCRSGFFINSSTIKP